MGAWDYIDWFKDIIFTPETGEGSEADFTRRKRMLDTHLITPNESPVANEIVDSAYARLNFDTTRPSQHGLRKDMVCADATCDIVSKVGIPWPQDKSGISASSVDFVIDAFEGRGEPGKLFSEHSEDFKNIGPGELSRGDILVLDVSSPSWQPDPEGNENIMELVNPPEYGYQKHMALITGVYEDGIEVVHDSGSDTPVYSKFYTTDFLNDMFDRAYRYNPNIDNEAFSHLVYNSE